MSSAANKRATVPVPLPTRRGVVAVPSSLRQSVTAALLASTNAIPQIQSTLNSSLETSGWTEKVQEYLQELLKSEEGRQMNDAQVLEAVVQAIRSSAGNGEGGQRGQPASGVENEKKLELGIPRTTAKVGVRVVREELEKVCDFVDELDWSA